MVNLHKELDSDWVAVGKQGRVACVVRNLLSGSQVACQVLETYAGWLVRGSGLIY